MTTYTLISPVEHAGKTYQELTFRKPKVKDLKVMDRFTGDTSKMVALLSSISDVPVPAFDEIEIEDFTAISEVAAAAMGESQKSTGAGSM